MSLDAPSVEPDAIDTLIQRCLAGDQAAWEQIVRTFRRRVFNIAYNLTGRHDLAEDLTQDVFVKIFKSLDTFDRRANFQTWLVSVSRNLCIDHYRSVRKEREAIDRDVDPGDLAPVSPTTSPYAALEATDRASLLRRGLKELAPSLREAVVLRDLQELSYQEIADKLGLPEGTVKSRINRGRNELARQISRIRESDDRAVAARTTGGGPDPPPERSGRMNFTIEQSQDVAIVRLDEARLMYPLLADFASAVTGLLDAGDKKVLLDFAKVTYVDSATIGCLVDLYRQATAKGGSLRLATVQKRVETMLTMTGAHNFLALHADEATALASFGA